MTLTLTTNIGKPDAARLGLKKTLEGEHVTVEKKVGEELLKHGWATESNETKTPDKPGK